MHIVTSTHSHTSNPPGDIREWTPREISNPIALKLFCAEIILFFFFFSTNKQKKNNNQLSYDHMRRSKEFCFVFLNIHETNGRIFPKGKYHKTSINISQTIKEANKKKRKAQAKTNTSSTHTRWQRGLCCYWTAALRFNYRMLWWRFAISRSRNTTRRGRQAAERKMSPSVQRFR